MFNISASSAFAQKLPRLINGYLKCRTLLYYFPNNPLHLKSVYKLYFHISSVSTLERNRSTKHMYVHNVPIVTAITRLNQVITAESEPRSSRSNANSIPIDQSGCSDWCVQLHCPTFFSSWISAVCSRYVRLEAEYCFAVENKHMKLKFLLRVAQKNTD